MLDKNGIRRALSQSFRQFAQALLPSVSRLPQLDERKKKLLRNILPTVIETLSHNKRPDLPLHPLQTHTGTHQILEQHCKTQYREYYDKNGKHSFTLKLQKGKGYTKA